MGQTFCNRICKDNLKLIFFKKLEIVEKRWRIEEKRKGTPAVRTPFCSYLRRLAPANVLIG